jgi:hypothetical protein
MNWEYKVLQTKAKAKSFLNSSPNLKDFETQLNELGRQGWELVTCQLPNSLTAALNESNVVAVFKRRK